MMAGASYDTRRGELTTYFDRTAVEAWSRLTSDAPVSRIRATVRAGRDAMRGTLLSWLPADMTGLRLLDAGCGTGALSVEAARRGAEVVAIDVSPTLVELARERLPAISGAGRIDFRVGDMLDPDLGRFDHVVAMDSLIHYRAADIVRARYGLADGRQHKLADIGARHGISAERVRQLEREALQKLRRAGDLSLPLDVWWSLGARLAACGCGVIAARSQSSPCSKLRRSSGALIGPSPVPLGRVENAANPMVLTMSTRIASWAARSSSIACEKSRPVSGRRARY